MARRMRDFSERVVRVNPSARAIGQELADGPSWAISWTKLSINQIGEAQAQDRRAEAQRGCR
jgi:hypothetical protein